MRYLSLCSGIEAASVAWAPLGWQPVAFAEIEPFPSAVLAHHYPDVSNLGDITRFKEWPDLAIDLLVGGTPCQSFSVAGLRQGLADPRGNLALTYLAIADRYRPRWVVWENVPGVLSSGGGRDFAAFLGGLGQLGYGWCYRVLDAQYVRVDGFARAVPQRRRRVFVVGCLGDWRRPAAVLSEPESVLGDSPPRREAGQGTATIAAIGAYGGGGLGTDFDCDGGLIPQVCGTLSDGAHMGGGLNGQGAYSGRIIPVAHSLRAEGFDANEDGTGRGTPLVPTVYPINTQIATRHEALGRGTGFGIGSSDDPAFTLQAGHGHAIAFNGRMDPVHGDVPGALDTDPLTQCVAFDMRGREGGAQFEGPHETANIRAASGGSSRSYVAQSWAVRRLTPTECERLQGFPDGYTAVPYRGKPPADGPRYKALGNSMAVNVMRWIGRRIEMVEAIADETRSSRGEAA